MDVYVYTAATSYAQFDVGNTQLKLNDMNLVLDGTAAIIDKLVASTSATRTIDDDDLGGTVLNSYAGTATLTLPAPSASNTGKTVTIICSVAQDMVINTNTGKMTVLGDLSANSITFDTIGEQIGATAHFYSTGSRWVLLWFTGQHTVAS
jgi:hypothetical protein